MGAWQFILGRGKEADLWYPFLTWMSLPFKICQVKPRKNLDSIIQKEALQFLAQWTHSLKSLRAWTIYILVDSIAPPISFDEFLSVNCRTYRIYIYFFVGKAKFDTRFFWTYWPSLIVIDTLISLQQNTKCLMINFMP